MEKAEFSICLRTRTTNLHPMVYHQDCNVHKKRNHEIAYPTTLEN